MAVSKKNRAMLRYIAIILFILAAIFLFVVNSVKTEVDLGLIALGLAAWAAA